MAAVFTINGGTALMITALPPGFHRGALGSAQLRRRRRVADMRRFLESRCAVSAARSSA